MREIEAAVEGRAWMLALAGTLALPDMCAAMESDNGKTTGARYKAWVETWLGGTYETLDSDELWQLRCSMLHQGRSKTRTYERVVFVAPFNGNVFHNNVINDALNLDLPTFCADVIAAVHSWRETMASNPNYVRNSSALMRWHPDGLPPYIVGAPVLL